MPQSVGFICPKFFDLGRCFHSVSFELGLKEYMGDEFSNSIQLQDEASGAYADFMFMSDQEAVKEEYLTNDSLPFLFRKDLTEKCFYMVSHNNFCFVQSIFQKILPFAEKCDGYFWVDDDDGNIFMLEEIFSENPNQENQSKSIGSDSIENQ